MTQTFCKDICLFCSKKITVMGMGRAAHMRTHVRSGDAKEIDNRHIEEHGGIHWEPTEKWKAGKTWNGKEWVKK